MLGEACVNCKGQRSCGSACLAVVTNIDANTHRALLAELLQLQMLASSLLHAPVKQARVRDQYSAS